MKPTLTWWGGLVNYEVSTKYVKEAHSTESCSYNRQVKRMLSAIYQDLSKCWLDKIRKVFSSKKRPLPVLILQYCLCAESGRLPGSVLESLEELSFTSRGFSRFNWYSSAQYQLPAWMLFPWLSLTQRQRSLLLKYFQSITSLIWPLTLHLLFCSLRKSLYSERK